MSWRLARSLTQLQTELDKRFPGRTKPDWTIGDPAHASRASDHNPNPAGVVCAIDVRTVRVAEAVWAHLLRTRDPRVKYMIFQRRIVSSTVAPWTVRSYSGSNPHQDHIHISVGRGPDGRSTGNYDDTSPWGLSTAKPAPQPTPAPQPGGTVTVKLPLLRRGAKTGAVKSLQALLNSKAGQGLKVDGDFGPATEGAVRNVQRYMRIQVDGIVGAQTWGALFL